MSNSTGIRWRRNVTAASAVVVALAGLGGLGISTGRAADLPATTTVDRGVPRSADAAAAWLTPQTGASEFVCRPDAAQRWQVPQIAVADLPHTADAMEAWLKPEIAIADLPHTADAMERWLCAP